MSYVGVTQSESGENHFYPSTFVMRRGPILNVLFDLSQLSSLPSQGVPLPMSPVGDGLPKWSPHRYEGLLYEVLSGPSMLHPEEQLTIQSTEHFRLKTIWKSLHSA